MSLRQGKSLVLIHYRNCAVCAQNHDPDNMPRPAAVRQYQIRLPILWWQKRYAGSPLHCAGSVWPDHSFLPSPHTISRHCSWNFRQRQCVRTSSHKGTAPGFSRHPQMPRTLFPHGWIHRQVPRGFLLCADCCIHLRNPHLYPGGYQSLYNLWYCIHVCPTQIPEKNKWHRPLIF